MLKKVSIIGALIAVLFAAMPSESQAHDYDRGDSDHPLRWITYALHPVGWVAEMAVLRPIHCYIIHHNEWTEEIMGHHANDPDGGRCWPAIMDKVEVTVVAAEDYDDGMNDMTDAGYDAAPVDEHPVIKSTATVDQLMTVYFDYDRHNIRADQLGKVEDNLAFLKANPGLKILLEGHCDERGTTEYNYSLGERRAKAIQAYLISGGISPDRIHMISKGEAEPAALGHNEAAWSQNRRVEFEKQIP